MARQRKRRPRRATRPLEGAEERIRDHRTAEATLRLVDDAGRPLANLRADVRLTRHEFLLGCNAFCIGAIEDKPLQRAYEERFAAILNYATLPFYWGGYEPRKDERQEDRLDAMAKWCAQPPCESNRACSHPSTSQRDGARAAALHDGKHAGWPSRRQP